MISWKRGHPAGRQFALVLGDHAYLPIPLVAQYDPPTDIWVDHDLHFEAPSSQCMWCEFPSHPSLDPKMSAVLVDMS